MSDITQNGCQVYRPTLAERFWRKVGYRYHLTDLPEDAGAMPGWAMTNVRLTLSFTDRVRLLLTGRIRLDVRQAMDVSVETVISATSLQILYPGEQF